jgi:predicted dehydrogenase
MDEVRIAIVGMGIGRPNAMALDANRRGRVVALCDLIEDRMTGLAKNLKGPVKTYTDYQAVCQASDVDAVFVGTPNQWHVPVGLEAVRNGKHVLVTKPLADSETAARQLVDQAEDSGVVNMMSLGHRFGDACQHLGQLVKQGYFGELYYAKARSFRRNGIPIWRGKDQLRLNFIQAGGGAFRDIGVHVLDASWWLLGTPKPVYALGAAGAKFGPRGLGYNGPTPEPEIVEQFDTDDYGTGFIVFDGGASIQIESFWAAHRPNEVQIEIFGTDAGAKTSPLTIYGINNGQPEDLTPEVKKESLSFERVAEYFISSILDGTPCQAPLRQGLVVQQMMEAVLKSAERGKPVTL